MPDGPSSSCLILWFSSSLALNQDQNQNPNQDFDHLNHLDVVNDEEKKVGKVFRSKLAR